MGYPIGSKIRLTRKEGVTGGITYQMVTPTVIINGNTSACAQYSSHLASSKDMNGEWYVSEEKPCNIITNDFELPIKLRAILVLVSVPIDCIYQMHHKRFAYIRENLHADYHVEQLEG